MLIIQKFRMQKFFSNFVLFFFKKDLNFLHFSMGKASEINQEIFFKFGNNVITGHNIFSLNWPRDEVGCS